MNQVIERIHELFRRGLIISGSNNLIVERLPDGRYIIKIRR